MNHLAVHLQHCKSTILQFKKKKKEVEAAKERKTGRKTKTKTSFKNDWATNRDKVGLQPQVKESHPNTREKVLMGK